MQYLEVFDTASHACGWRQEGHPVIKTLLQYSSLTLLKKECYEEEVQPYLKPDYKPMIYIYIYIYVNDDIVAVLISLMSFSCYCSPFPDQRLTRYVLVTSVLD